MALNYTPEKIKQLIETSKIAEPYSKGSFKNELDKKYDSARLMATRARDLLDMYFAEHPNDKIENYM